MKVILLEDVKKVGKKDEIIEVNQGYGHNFLIKTKKAVEATETNLSNLKIKLEKEEVNKKQEKEEAEEIKNKLEKETFIFHLNKGSNGNVFGKISTKQIAKKLQENGYNVDRKSVLSDGVNHLGEETVEVLLHKQVKAKVKIEVLGD